MARLHGFEHRRRLDVSRASRFLVAQGELKIADLLEDLHALVVVGRGLGHAAQGARGLQLVAAFDGQVGQRAQGLRVAWRKTQGRFVQGRGALGSPQPQLGLRGMGERLRNLLGILEGHLVRGDGFEVGGGLAPAPRLEAVLAQGDAQHELAGHGPIGLDELAVAFLESAQLFVHLAQAVVEPRGLHGLSAQAA